MAAEVKGRTTHGNGQARPGWRAAVVGAARIPFLERGYGATTIEAICEASDVPPATVYRLFSSKRGILKALLDVSIVGDDEADADAGSPAGPVSPVGSRPEAPAGWPRRDHRRDQLENRFVYRILVSAAGSDPDRPRPRRADSAAATRAEPGDTLAGGAGALRPTLRERDAADIIHALMSPELYRLLVVERGCARTGTSSG